MFTPSTRLEADLPVPDATDPDGDGEQSLMLRQVASDAVEAALGAGTRAPGPVHLNLPFREPLGGDLPARGAAGSARRISPPNPTSCPTFCRGDPAPS
jgi:2-succinyl-5-enolpyruvyl-6-hydroxy-3-cyclohexene-1-carboxylate synthase